MNQAIWVLVNCNSKKEAENIGRKILRKRFCSCFDIIPRYLAVFYWPPKSGKIEKAKGATLILESLSEKYNLIKIYLNIGKINKIFILYLVKYSLFFNY